MEMAMFYMKVAGSVVVIITGTYMGILFSRDIEKRYDELCDLRKSFIIIHADISYGSISLGEILEHVSRQALPIHSQWLQKLESNLREERNQTFAILWRDSIDACLDSSHMNKQEIQELIDVGTTMGNVDKNQQLSMLTLYLKRLELRIASLEQEKDKKQKLYRTLGMLGSVFVVVLLI